MAVVESESSKTFNKILDFAGKIVSTTMIVTGVRCFGLFLLGLMSIASLARIYKLVYTSSAKMLCTLCAPVSVCPVEFTIEIVLQESIFLN